MKKRASGFTLIELLVVIAIIGVLSSVVLASLNSARDKAYDARRKADVIQIRNALAAYYSDNGSYPLAYPSAWGGVTTAPCGTNAGTSGSGAYIAGLTPTYIPYLPVDPHLNTGACDGYLYNSTGAHYKFLVHTSPARFPVAGEAFYDPRRPGWSWMITDKDDTPPGGISACDAPGFDNSDWPICW